MSGAGVPPDAAWRRRAWPWELLLLVVAYEAYRSTRILVTGREGVALAHARQVVGLERHLGIFVEGRVHQAALRHPAVLHACDLYYGTIHFVVPAVALLVLYRRHPTRYERWRNVFGWLLALGLVGFAAYPLLPPHLLPPAAPAVPAASNPFAWNAENPYAAMPSLHIAWAVWSALALMPVVRSRLLRGALAVYPVVTLAVVVATANHYLLDAAGGLLALSGAWGLEALRCRRATRAASGDGVVGTLVVRPQPLEP